MRIEDRSRSHRLPVQVRLAHLVHHAAAIGVCEQDFGCFYAAHRLHLRRAFRTRAERPRTAAEALPRLPRGERRTCRTRGRPNSSVRSPPRLDRLQAAHRGTKAGAGPRDGPAADQPRSRGPRKHRRTKPDDRDRETSPPASTCPLRIHRRRQWLDRRSRPRWREAEEAALMQHRPHRGAQQIQTDILVRDAEHRIDDDLAAILNPVTREVRQGQHQAASHRTDARGCRGPVDGFQANRQVGSTPLSSSRASGAKPSRSPRAARIAGSGA